MLISVIITTSPGREQNLHACLEMLQRQSLAADQIIVVDDGSASGQLIAERYSKKLPLEYFWRANDCRVAYSRNQGARAAQGRWLVFLDSDMLLNPQGLAAYADYLESFPQHALYGYFGYALESRAVSYFLPGRQILWCDRRFDNYTPQGLVPAANMLRFPHEWAWSGNFALSRELYWQTGGFDQRYRGWGGEDLDFASRLLQSAQIHFFVDAWAEQQLHTRDERFHTLSDSEREVIYESHYDQASYQPRVIYSAAGWVGLRQAIYSHYLPQEAKTEPESP